MATWNSRGLRGSVLEELINYANQKYKDKDLALIQKIPTPITPVRFDKESRHITLAYSVKKTYRQHIPLHQSKQEFPALPIRFLYRIYILTR